MPSESLAFVVKLLAIVGGAVVGGFFVGWFMRSLVMMTTGQRLPALLHWTCRSVGGLICGWLMYLFVFSSGNGGLGGSGGLGTGGSSGNPDKTDTTTAHPSTANPKTTGLGVTESGDAVTIEVLGEDDIKRIDPDRFKKGELDHCYRLFDGDRRLLTLDQIKEAIEGRQQRSPPLQRIILIRYKDTPGVVQDPVANIKNWAEQLPVLVDGRPTLVDGRDKRVYVEVERKATMSAPLK